MLEAEIEGWTTLLADYYTLLSARILTRLTQPRLVRKKVGAGVDFAMRDSRRA